MDGGPAFFLEVCTKFDARSGAPTESQVHRGMSLRDYFAGQALVGLLACGPHDCEEDAIAHDAYLHADAMLAFRARTQEQPNEPA